MRNLILIILLVTSSFSANAQMEKYKAIFIYKFAQNFEWPANKTSNSYKIGILGNNELFDELTQLVDGRTIEGKPIEVVKYMPGSNSDDLCMLFISDKDKGSFDVLNDMARANSTVIIGESAGLAKKGAPLNFVSSGGSLKFELNEASMNLCNVKAPVSIKSLAVLVK